MVFRVENDDLISPPVTQINLYEFTDPPTYKQLSFDIYTFENQENSMFLVSSYLDGETEERKNVLYRHDIQILGYKDTTLFGNVILGETCPDTLSIHNQLIVVGCLQNQRIIFVERSTMALLGFFFQLPVSLEFHRVVDYSNSIPQNSILDFKSKFIEIIERMGQTYVFFVTYQQVE